MLIYNLLKYYQLNSNSALTCSFEQSAKAFKSYPPSKIDITLPLVNSLVAIIALLVIS